MFDDLAFELHLTAEGNAAPDLVQLLPAGTRIAARDGGFFTLDDPEGVVERSWRGIELVVDFEHQNDEPERQKNGPVPAAGWIKDRSPGRTASGAGSNGPTARASSSPPANGHRLHRHNETERTPAHGRHD